MLYIHCFPSDKYADFVIADYLATGISDNDVYEIENLYLWNIVIMRRNKILKNTVLTQFL